MPHQIRRNKIGGLFTQGSFSWPFFPNTLKSLPIALNDFQINRTRISAIADCAVLILMATVGVIARLHETSAEAHQLTWVAIFLYGAARALDRPLAGGAIAGAAIAASVCTRGLLPASALLATALALPLLGNGWRLVAGSLVQGFAQ